MNTAFWQGKTVFVTGHTGFKGSWLCLWLKKMGARVIGFSLAPPSTPNLFEIIHLEKNIDQHITADINDLVFLKKILLSSKPDIIFHLAAQALVQDSYQFPVETYQTNVMGTVNILEAARACESVKVIVNITSDKCYENKEWGWGYRENEPLGGYDPYSSSKACAELVTSAYRQSFLASRSQSLASARAGNVIGGGDWANNRLVPDMMRAFLKGEEVHIRHPEAIRPWQHVLEPLSGYLLLAEKLWENPLLSEAFNFGPYEKDIQPVSFITDYLSRLWGENPDKNSQHLNNTGFGHEAGILKLDISKAKNQLGWQPALNLPQALEYVISWYKAFENQQDMRALTLSQIDRYAHLREKSTGVYS